MRKIIILTMCVLIVAVLFASCSNALYGNNANINSDIDQAGQSDNSSVINSAGNALISNDEQKGELMFSNISPVSIFGSDRMPRSASLILSYPEIDAKEKTVTAICVVTVLDIDTSDCSSNMGKRIPIMLRIDSIIGSNPAFILNVDDSVLVTDYSYWTKDRGGYFVNYNDGTIPITERNAQYIVLIYSTDEETKESVQSDIEYSVEALTIPITKIENISCDDIYRYLKLPDDVIQCSEELINQFIKKK